MFYTYLSIIRVEIEVRAARRSLIGCEFEVGVTVARRPCSAPYSVERTVDSALIIEYFFCKTVLEPLSPERRAESSRLPTSVGQLPMILQNK